MIILSVRPYFAEKILSGKKTIELRRQRPRVSIGDRIVMYVSSPEKAITALLEVEDIVQGSPHSVWDKVESRAGVTFPEYQEYFQGAASAVALQIRVIERLDSPFRLTALRKLMPAFSPPQSFRYVRSLDEKLRGAIERLWADSPPSDIVLDGSRDQRLRNASTQ